jgi:hypothetical protein
VRGTSGARQLLGHEPPAGGGLQGEVGRLAVELHKPGAQLQASDGAELPRQVSPLSVSIQS